MEPGQEAPSAFMQAKIEELGLGKSPEDFVASLPGTVQRRVAALRELQTGKDTIEAQLRAEKAALEAKYEKLFAPLYEQRREIVAGSASVPALAGEAASTAADTGIPEFWLCVLLKCQHTQSLISEKDVEVLKYMTNISSSVLLGEDGAVQGFNLHFHFAPNPYFSHPVLEKSYHMLPDDDAILEKSEATKIVWNAGKDVTIKIMKKKPKKGSKDTKPMIKAEKVQSFFLFFTPPEVPEDEAALDDEEAEELQMAMETDYEIGIAVKERIIPHAIEFYTGEGESDDGFGDGEDGEDSEDDGEE